MTTTFNQTGYDDHVKNSLNLEVEGYRELFEITLFPPAGGSSILLLTKPDDCTWQGRAYEGYQLTLTGDGRDSSGQRVRPKLTVVNPSGVFSRYAHQKWTDNAQVVRYRVLNSHIRGNINGYAKNTWRISKTLSLDTTMAVFELRSALDGQNFYLPGRAYYPPEFPHVSLS